MSGGRPATSIFDPTKYYRSVLHVPGQEAWDIDFNEMQEIQDYYLRNGLIDLSRCSVVIISLTGKPVKSAEESIVNLPTDGIFEFYFMTASTIKWRKNAGAWDDNGGSGYTVVTDGDTVNENVGGSGVNVVFSVGQVANNTAQVSIGYSFKSIGNDPSYHSAYKVTCPASIVYFYGYRIIQVASIEDIPSATTNNFLYYDVYLETIDYTTDPDFAHKMADGRDNEPSPDRSQLKFEICVAESIPTAPTGHTYIPYAKTVDTGSGVLTVVPLIKKFGYKFAVAAEDLIPMIPKYLRASTGLDNSFRSFRSLLGRRELGDLKAYVKIKWNDYGTGTGSSNKLTVTDSDAFDGVPNYTTNEWAGYTLHDSSDAEFIIISNTATELVVDGTPASGAFTLHSGGVGYHFVLKRHVYDIDGNPGDWIKAKEYMSLAMGSGPLQEHIINGIEVGETIRVRVAACGTWYADSYSSYSELDTQAYWFAQLASSTVIEDLVLTASDTGFKAEVTIVEDYKSLIQSTEVIWSDDGSTPDPDSSTSVVRPVASKAIASIPASVNATATAKPYKAKARALDIFGRWTTGWVTATEIQPEGRIVDVLNDVKNMATAIGTDGNLTVAAIERITSYQTVAKSRVEIYPQEGPEIDAHELPGTGDWEKAVSTMNFNKSATVNNVYLMCKLWTSDGAVPVSLKVIVTYPGATPMEKTSNIVMTYKEESDPEAVNTIFALVVSGEQFPTGMVTVDLYYKTDLSYTCFIKELGIVATP